MHAPCLPVPPSPLTNLLFQRFLFFRVAQVFRNVTSIHIDVDVDIVFNNDADNEDDIDVDTDVDFGIV